MSVELKIKIQENCDSVYLFDATGKYDAKCNKTGWGNPNEIISNSTSAIINITLPKASEPISIDVYPDLPSDCNLGYEILPEDIGTETIKSGVYSYTYNVGLNTGEILSVTDQSIAIKDIECCIYKKYPDININNFETQEIIDFNNLMSLIQAAKDSFCIGEIDKSQKIIDYLYNQCNCKH